jgi:Phage integrase, N-terminal SAM-like domain
VARRDPVIIAGKKRGRPGRWIVHYYHAPGKRTWKTFKAREAAEEFRIETLKTRAGDPGGETDFTITLGDYAKHVWLPTVRATVKRLSARRYEEMLRLHVLPAFKDHKVRLLTRDQVKRLLVAKLSDGLSRPTVKLILSTLRALLNDAREAKIITDNPARHLDGNSSSASLPKPRWRRSRHSRTRSLRASSMLRSSLRCPTARCCGRWR